MNLFNRGIGFVIGVLVAVGGILILAALAGLLVPDVLALGWWIDMGLSWFAGLASPDRWWAVFAGAIAVVGGIGLASMEIGMGGPEPAFLLRDAPAGRVRVSIAAIRSIAEHAGSQVDGVMAIDSAVRTHGERLHVECRVRVGRETIIPRTAEEVQQLVSSALADQLGLDAATVNVNAAVGVPTRLPAVR